MPENVFKVALAGLLHDLGSFARRANRDPTGQPVPEELVPAQYRPETDYMPILDIAATLAAGASPGLVADQPQQLQSIFSTLKGWTPAQDAPEAQKRYVPLRPLLELEEGMIFPEEAVAQPGEAYQALWTGFEAGLRALGETYRSQAEAALPAYLAGLLDLMQRYTWCVPAPHAGQVVDVSLYDHSRMTAALAACLVAQQDQALIARLAETWQQPQPVAVLVGGDISGVQRFIYTITSGGAAKSLRGRSFYLQLLTEAVARYVLDQLDLPPTNLIYAGGGNFFMLAPVKTAHRLRDIRRDVTERLLAAHDGELHLVMAYSPVEAGEFERSTFHQSWQRLHVELSRAKLRPLSDLPVERLVENVGQGLGVGGDTDRLCGMCGREIGQGETTHPGESGGEPIRVCGLCDSLETLGNELAKATHLVTLVSTARPARRVDKWWRGLETFGLNVWAVDTSREPPNASDRYVRLADGVRLVDVTRLNHDRAKHHERLMGELTQNGLPVINTFRPFAQLVPTDRYGNPLTFDQLAERSTGGVKRWGVLRLDVDNLGQLFETGFRRRQNGQAENRLTISRLAGLSFALRLFFEGWLPRLGESGERLAERLYVQYAGGDDLFVVGSWDALPEFAAVIRGSFQDFVCHNPYVTLSGGVTLAPEKYPLYQAARDAERAEHAAKAFNRPAQAANGRPTDKDAFCFLGQVVGWEAFEPVRERAYQLAGWCGDEGQVSRALLQTLLSIHVEHRRGREQALEKKQWRPGQIYFGPWMWHLAYHLARRIQDKRTPPEVKEDLAALETEMLASPANIETIGLAARWAQFLIRK